MGNKIKVKIKIEIEKKNNLQDGDGVISFEEFKNAVGDLDIERKMAFIGFK